MGGGRVMRSRPEPTDPWQRCREGTWLLADSTLVTLSLAAFLADNRMKEQRWLALVRVVIFMDVRTRRTRPRSMADRWLWPWGVFGRTREDVAADLLCCHVTRPSVSRSSGFGRGRREGDEDTCLWLASEPRVDLPFLCPMTLHPAAVNSTLSWKAFESSSRTLGEKV